MGRNSSTPKSDNYQKVTDAMVASLEKGVAPWVCPWDRSAGMPHNGHTGHTYTGINTWLCWSAGFSDPRWFTFNQVGNYGKSHVRKGEHGTPIVFWKFIEKTEKQDDGTEETKRFPMLRVFTVFNFEQIEWDEEHLPKGVVTKEIDPATVSAEAQALLDASGAKVVFGGERACYIPSKDEIRLPLPGTFDSGDAYWGTTLHELIHWTGAPTRCNRDLSGRFGTDGYAMEELVAELGAAFLCADVGVKGQLQHAEYLGHWIKVLKGDKYAIFSASSRAKEAAQWLHAQAGEAAPGEAEGEEFEAAA